MKKLIFVLISVLLLASCSQGALPAENVSASPAAAVTAEATQTPPVPSPTVSVPPTPSPSPSTPLVANIIYHSCETGEKISKTVTTDDIKLFLSTPPDKLPEILGISIQKTNYPSMWYFASCDYLGLTLLYHGDEYYEHPKIKKPEVPVDFIRIDGFEFRSLDKNSNFGDVMNTLGKAEIQQGAVEGTEVYYIQYNLNGMIFEFYGGDDPEGLWGIELKIHPGN
jgi:hypothetical protein